MALLASAIHSFGAILIIREIIIVLLSLCNLISKHSSAGLDDHLLAVSLTVGDKCLIPIGDTGEIAHRRPIGVVQFIDNLLLIGFRSFEVFCLGDVQLQFGTHIFQGLLLLLTHLLDSLILAFCTFFGINEASGLVIKFSRLITEAGEQCYKTSNHSRQSHGEGSIQGDGGHCQCSGRYCGGSSGSSQHVTRDGRDTFMQGCQGGCCRSCALCHGKGFYIIGCRGN